MKLMNGEKAWTPEEFPELYCLISEVNLPPQNKSQFLSRQYQILKRLVEESSQEDRDYAEKMLREYLPLEARMVVDWGNLWSSGLSRLIWMEVEEGKMWSLKQLAEEVLPYQGPLLDEETAKEEIEDLDLVAFVQSSLISGGGVYSTVMQNNTENPERARLLASSQTEMLGRGYRDYDPEDLATEALARAARRVNERRRQREKAQSQPPR
ncbi:MAG: hypothetical protein P9M08_02520 [Candidatus Erginobacter occultus]|nr:hypothetical protein [Candidatus Erginobacter occultus]